MMMEMRYCPECDGLMEIARIYNSEDIKKSPLTYICPQCGYKEDI